MQTDLIIVSEYCNKCHIEPSFILMLEEDGLIEIQEMNKEKYLFDLVNDPLEKVNLVDDGAYEEIKNALKERLTSFGEEAGEAFIVEC